MEDINNLIDEGVDALGWVGSIIVGIALIPALLIFILVGMFFRLFR